MSPQYSPLASEVVFRLGVVEVCRPVVTTWGIILVLGVASWLGTRHASTRPGRWQTILEAGVSLFASQIREIVRRDPQPFLPLVGTMLSSSRPRIFRGCCRA